MGLEHSMNIIIKILIGDYNDIHRLRRVHYVTKSIIVAFECTTLKDAGPAKCVLNST